MAKICKSYGVKEEEWTSRERQAERQRGSKTERHPAAEFMAKIPMPEGVEVGDMDA